MLLSGVVANVSEECFFPSQFVCSTHVTPANQPNETAPPPRQTLAQARDLLVPTYKRKSLFAGNAVILVLLAAAAAAIAWFSLPLVLQTAPSSVSGNTTLLAQKQSLINMATESTTPEQKFYCIESFTL